MKRAFLLGTLAGAAFIAGAVTYFWLDEIRLDRQWIPTQTRTPRPMGLRP